MDAALAREIMIRALQVVATDAAGQIALFPSWVCIPDEIALTFHDARLLFEGYCAEEGPPAEVLSMVMALDATLKALSGTRNQDFWTLEALREDIRWQHIREEATRILQALGAPPGPPRIDALYARGRGERGLGGDVAEE